MTIAISRVLGVFIKNARFWQNKLGFSYILATFSQKLVRVLPHDFHVVWKPWRSLAPVTSKVM